MSKLDKRLQCLVSGCGAREAVSILKALCAAQRTGKANCLAQTGILDDQERFLNLVVRHRISALFSDIDYDGVEHIGLILQQKAQIQQRKYAYQLADIIAASKSLKKNGIPFVVLKGVAISERYYPKPGLRFSNDIDLLISPDQTLECINGFLDEGHTQIRPDFMVTDRIFTMLEHKTSGVDILLAQSNNIIELHWRCVQNREMLSWNYDLLKSLAERVVIGDETVEVLPPVYQLVYLACHGSKHGWFRLKWIYDIHLIVSEMNAETQQRVKTVATENGTARMLALALSVSRYFYQTPLKLDEDWILGNLNPHAFKYCIKKIVEDDIVSNSFTTRVINTAERLLYRWSLRSSLRYKLNILSQSLYGLNDIGTLRLSGKWLPVYWVLGPLLFTLRFIKARARKITH